MKNLFDIDVNLGETRVYRQLTFDRHTFDLFMDMKRLMNKQLGDCLTNSEVLKAVVLSHPALSEVKG